MVANIVIVAIVVALFALCIRSFVKNGGTENCADCTVEGCNASLRAQGKCVAAEDMLERVNKAVADGTLDGTIKQ